MYGYNNIRLSWYYIFISVLLQLITGLITLIVVAERTIDWLFFNNPELPIGLLLISGWTIALLSFISRLLVLIGVLLDRNL